MYPWMPEIEHIEFMDERSFESLFRLYNAGLKVYALKFVKQTDAAEDIVHDIFINLWLVRHKIRVQTVKTYLFNAVRNRCLKYLDHLKVKNEYQQEIINKGDILGSLTWDYYVRTELEAHIEKALTQLTPQQRKIFMMSREENKTSAQIGAELGLSPRTVEKHMEMALRKMRQELSEYLPLFLVGLVSLKEMIPKSLFIDFSRSIL